MTDSSADVGTITAVVTSVVSLLGGGLLGSWIQRIHERRLRSKEQEHAVTLQKKQNEFNVLLEDDRRRAENEIERLRNDLERQRVGYARVHELAAEREFQCYTEIWRDLMAYLEVFQGKIGHGVPGDRKQWEDELKNSRQKFVRNFRDSRPFYYVDVFQACVSLNNEAHLVEATDFETMGPRMADRRRESLDQINTQVNRIVEAMRRRISETLSLGRPEN